MQRSCRALLQRRAILENYIIKKIKHFYITSASLFIIFWVLILLINSLISKGDGCGGNALLSVSLHHQTFEELWLAILLIIFASFYFLSMFLLMALSYISNSTSLTFMLLCDFLICFLLIFETQLSLRFGFLFSVFFFHFPIIKLIFLNILFNFFSNVFINCVSGYGCCFSNILLSYIFCN